VGLQITCGGGVAALRALEGAIENEGGRRTLHADLVARERASRWASCRRIARRGEAHPHFRPARTGAAAGGRNGIAF
jgi:hypothetical protein